ncbi:MAG: hypothetical protein IPN74_06870 [Haliscomenobacter sp.]|nr:hypothetical protein [Haliscomenobacter sp.]
MKTFSYTLAALLLFALAGCGNEKKAQEAEQVQLRSELMVVHDEVMPMMGELTSLAGQLKQTLQADSTLAPDVRAQMETAVAQMTEAEEGMMDWMANFKQPENLRAEMDHKAIMAYLSEEKDKISEVGAQIKSGIETGKALVAAAGNRK